MTHLLSSPYEEILGKVYLSMTVNKMNKRSSGESEGTFFNLVNTRGHCRYLSPWNGFIFISTVKQRIKRRPSAS